MNLPTFRRIARQVEELAASKVKFDIAIRNDSEYGIEQDNANFEPVNFQVTGLKQLALVQSITQKSINLGGKTEIKGLIPTPCVTSIEELVPRFKSEPLLRSRYPSLKYVPIAVNPRQYYNMYVYMINEKPTEQIEEDVTYRYIGSKETCRMCMPHDSPFYNYLDFGFFFTYTNSNHSKPRLIITNELTLDTMLVMAIISQNPKHLKLLQNECFLNANLAKVLRIKLEKEDIPNRYNYERFREAAMKDYEKSVNSGLLQKILDKKVVAADFNGIKLSHNKVQYEAITLEADDLLAVLQSAVVFDDRTDIFVLVRGYISYTLGQVDGVTLDGVKKTDETRSFTINGIKITLKRVHTNTRRYVNDVMINFNEVEDVCYRATCLRTQLDFDKFVKTVSRLSLARHDILAKGLPVKLLDNMTYRDYHKAVPPLGSPKVRIMKDGTDYKLVLDEAKKEYAKVNFGLLIKTIAHLNRMINDGYITDGRRNAAWGRKELAKVLKQCCTFTTIKKVKEKVKNALGVETGEVVTKDVVITTCHLTDKQAESYGEQAKKIYEAALEKEKLFLAMAVKATGAKEIDFKGDKGYMIEGKLHKYFVNKETNQVMNFDTGKYICIVEEGHVVSTGGDATAQRLFALKNDALTVASITTLRHA